MRNYNCHDCKYHISIWKLIFSPKYIYKCNNCGNVFQLNIDKFTKTQKILYNFIIIIISSLFLFYIFLVLNLDGHSISILIFFFMPALFYLDKIILFLFSYYQIGPVKNNIFSRISPLSIYFSYFFLLFFIHIYLYISFYQHISNIQKRSGYSSFPFNDWSNRLNPIKPTYSLFCNNEKEINLVGQKCEKSVYFSKDEFIGAHCGQDTPIRAYTTTWLPYCNISYSAYFSQNMSSCLNTVKNAFSISTENIPLFFFSMKPLYRLMSQKFISQIIYPQIHQPIKLIERQNRLEIHDSEELKIITDTGWLFTIFLNNKDSESISNSLNIDCNIIPKDEIKYKYNKLLGIPDDFK